MHHRRLHLLRNRGLGALLGAVIALAGCGGGRDAAPPVAAPAAAAQAAPPASGTAGGSAARLRAQAVVPTQRLSVSAAAGGRVFSVPSGLDCGAVCSLDVEAGSRVSLRAVAAPGYAFDGWSGDCSDPSACSVTMSAARTVTARFVPVSPLAECSVTRSSATTPQIPATHPRLLLAQSELRSCLQRQMSLGAPAAARMKAYVDSQMASGNIYGFEPWFAALVYQATSDTRYADYAVQRTDAWVAAEEARIAAGQRAEVAGDSYLYVGEIVGGLATVYDWAHDRVSASQRARWIAYANQAVWNVWNPTQARWGGRSFPWSGWSVDNPVNNYYYHFLRATMFLGLATHGENDQAQAWITMFRTTKLQNQLLPQFNAQLQGGGSREGTGYGTSLRSLWELYDWWERSTGERVATLTPHTLDSIAHQLHSMTPTLDRLAPTGDHSRDSTAALFDYHRHYLQSLIALFPQERLSAIARSALDRSTVPRMRYSYDYYADFIYGMPALPSAQLSELSTAYWGPGTGQLMMRSGWDTEATFANFICGPYTESHAHRDQGSFVLFKGDWLAWDANIASTSGIEQGEDQHNLVRVFRGDGSEVRQRVESPPCRLLALAHHPLYTYAVADVTPVYGGDPALGRIEREFLFVRPGTVVVMDRVAAAAGSRKVWTLNLPGQPELSPGRMRYAAGGHTLDVHGLAPAGVTGSWVGGRRVEVADSQSGQSEFLHVMATDGAVSAAVRDDAPGQIGARIALSDGRSLLVRFNSGSGRGGQAELRAADGTLVAAGTLATTVQAPPLMAGDVPPPPPPQPPGQLAVAISQPLPGSSFVAPASFQVLAQVSAPDAVVRVELWRNGQKVADDATAPYAFAQSGVPAGSWRYEARAVTQAGTVTASAPVTVTVTDPPPPPPPSVDLALSRPADGARVERGTAVALDVSLVGTAPVARLEYLAGAAVVATRTAAPWSATWTPGQAGEVELRARATLADGRVIDSATRRVTVVDPPAPPPPTGNALTLRQGLDGYAGAVDLGVTSQYLRYNGGKGVVTNDAVSGAYRIGGSSGYESRSFLRFGGLEVLRGRRVQRAELRLSFSFGAQGYTLAGRYLAVPWDPAASRFGWTRRDDVTPWAAPGSGSSDWVSGRSFTVSGFTGAAADTRTVALDPAQVQAWIDQPSSNHGLVLLATATGRVSWLRTSEDPDPALRPTLVVWLD